MNHSNHLESLMTPQYMFINYQTTPPHVSKNLPKAINRRINQLSSTEQIFNNSKHDYEVALKKSGHHQNLTYQPNTRSNANANRKRKQRTRDEIYFT